MILGTRMKVKALMMIAFLFFALGVYSLSAQGLKSKQGTAVDQSQGTQSDQSTRKAPAAELAAVPMQPALNSVYCEMKPTLTPDGSRLYFSRSYHPQNTLGKNDKEDIWYSNFSKISETWSDPMRMPGYINNDGPNFINNISTTGDTLFLGNRYGKNGRMSAGVSYSVSVDGKWSIPVNIDIQNDYNISEHSNAFVSPKNHVIIQSIQRSETFGGRDLYISFWDGKMATEPVNMGSVINTDQEESSPFLAADNKTLYFASKGHTGLGGFDIYATTRLDETWANWSEPVNLGASVNGTLDDEFFSISPGGKYATLTKQIDADNADLFKISADKLVGQPVKKNDKPVQHETSSFASL